MPTGDSIDPQPAGGPGSAPFDAGTDGADEREFGEAGAMKIDRTLTARSTWVTPVLLILGLAAALPAIYLSSTVDPQGHLSGLPVALVVEQGGTSAGSSADAVASTVEADAPNTLAIERMSADELDNAMERDEVAGAIVVPADLREPVAVKTNAGDGGLSTALLLGNVTPLLHSVSEQVGGFQIASGPYEPLRRTPAWA